jgi:membrane-associated protease RseP (regulator of RpoE activity)
MQTHLVWSLALGLAGCLAGAPVAAQQAPVKRVQERIELKTDDSECGPGEAKFIQVIKDEDGKTRIIEKRLAAGPHGFLGVHLVGLTSQLREHFTGDAKRGVLVGQVEADSPALRAGIRVGDVITTLDGQPVASALDLGQRIGAKKQGTQVELGLVRAGAALEVTASLVERTRSLQDLTKGLKWVGQAGELEIDEQELGEDIDREVIEKLGDPAIRKEIRIIKDRHQTEQRLEEKLRQVEERLRQLEQKLQGRLAPGSSSASAEG